MSQQQLDYFGPDRPRMRRWWTITAVSAAVVVFANLVLLGVAWWDSSFLALRVAFYDLPRANLAASVACAALSPWVWKRSGFACAALHAGISIGLPYFAVKAGVSLIGNMNLHGC
jgi:hypothetical protein